MDFESPDVEKDFPGLYNLETSRRSDSDYGENGSDKTGKKELLKSVKKKEKNKDKGYAALGEDSSPEDAELLDSRSPLRPKMTKSFKFLHKKEEKKEEKKVEKREEKKEDKKKKVDKKEEKKKKVEEKKREKEEMKRSKKDKKRKVEVEEEEEFPVFGEPLSVAIERCPSHDGLQLPAVVRQCIDYVEENGLHCEGIYRLSGVKSKVQHLRRLCNCGRQLPLSDVEPHVVASLLKQFLRELPEPVLTLEMTPHFEDAAMIPNPAERAEAARQLIDRLPTANRLLLQYMFKHMGHIIANEKETKMTYQNVSIVLSPTMRISHRVLSIFFLNHNLLFGDFMIKKYVPPIGTVPSDPRCIDDLISGDEIRDEIAKQESLLWCFHREVAAGRVSQKKEEVLWEAQRILTDLKRKLRVSQRRGDSQDTVGSIDKDSSKDTSEKDSKDSSSNNSEDSHRGSEPEPRLIRDGNVTVVQVRTQVESDGKYPELCLKKIERNGLCEKSDKLASETVEKIKERNAQKRKTLIFGEREKSSEKCERKISVTTTAEIHKCQDARSPVENASSGNDFSSVGNNNGMGKVTPGEGVEVCHVTVIQLGGKDAKEMEGTRKSSIDGKQEKEEMMADAWKPNVDVRKPVIKNHTENILKKNIISAESGDAMNYFFYGQSVASVGAGGQTTRSGEADAEWVALVAEEGAERAEEMELRSMQHDLTRKLGAERAEIGRLKEEIEEMQTLYGYRMYPYDSSESDASESEGESDTEEEIIAQLQGLHAANATLQSDNTSLTQRIQGEREAIVKLRVQLRQLRPLQCHQSTTTHVC